MLVHNRINFIDIQNIQGTNMQSLKIIVFALILITISTKSFSDNTVKISKLSKAARLGTLRVGAPRSTPFKFSRIPDGLKSSAYVFVPRGDGNKPGKGFSFSVNKPVLVYLSVLRRGAYSPKGWKKTNLKIVWKVGKAIYVDDVYIKKFPAGKIKIPAHTGMAGVNSPPYGVGHAAIIQAFTAAKATEFYKPEIKISALSKSAVLRQKPTRILMGNILITIPDVFENSQFVCMPRGQSNQPGKGFNFTIDKDSDVYISVHKRGKPEIKGWQKDNSIIYWSYSGHRYKDDVYKKYFKAGKVIIPPNNGSNGWMYGVPNVAIIKPLVIKKKAIYSWTWQQLGLKPVLGQVSSNGKPFVKLSTQKTIELELPPSKLKAAKVYKLHFRSKGNNSGNICISTSPQIPQPFGKIFHTDNFWNKITCPVYISASHAKQRIVFKITIPANTCIEAPVLIEDKSGIIARDKQIINFFSSSKWKAVNMGESKEIFQEIKAGSALDFSKLTARVPAGSKGRIIINKNGQLAFEEEANTSLRFSSLSFPFYATCRTYTDVDKIIKRISIQGYNMVRFHAISFAKGKYQKNGVTIDQAKFIPQNADEFKEYFNEDRLKLFDYVLAELGKHGIYVYFDIMTAYTGWTDAVQAGHWLGKDLLGKQFHAQLYVNKAFRQNWKAGITYLLNRSNTVSGGKWKDDPVFACMLFMNEQNFRLTPSYLSAFEPQWKKYYGTNAPILSEKLLKSNSLSGKKAGEFMLQKVEEMTDFFHKAVRDAGYKGLLTNWDLYMRMIDVAGREKLQVVSMHSYHGHPGLPIKNSRSVSGYPVSNRGEIWLNRKSSIMDNGAYLSRIIVMRNINRPTMIMEYGDTPPNPYRHEAGLFFASYSKLNGVDVLMPHGHVIAHKFDPLTPYSFSDFNDPIFRASSVINAFAFLRGDVKTGKHNVEFLITPKILDSANRIDALAVEYTKTFLMTKVGTKYTAGIPLDSVGKVKADLQIVPKLFARARGTSVEAVITDNESRRPKIIKDIVAALRKKNILDNKNRTNPDKDIFESETNQLLIMPSKGTLQVNTPRLEGAVLKHNKPVKINALSITNCSVPAAVTMISLDANRDLSHSKHLLLVFSTNCVNSGMVTNTSGSRLLKTGGPPLLMLTAKLSVTLNNLQKKPPLIYALNLDGTREEKIDAIQNTTGLHINIDTSRLKYATPFFEIIY